MNDEFASHGMPMSVGVGSATGTFYVLSRAPNPEAAPEPACRPLSEGGRIPSPEAAPVPTGRPFGEGGRVPNPECVPSTGDCPDRSVCNARKTRRWQFLPCSSKDRGIRAEIRRAPGRHGWHAACESRQN
jgi:hypothetical protein